MEVHHHPEIEKKNFKEYLLEGLMIFLAVTMGFIAESLRENMTAKDKEMDYIVSFVNNLEKDKTDLASSIADNDKKEKGLDSLLSLSGKDMADAKNRKNVYYLSWCISWLSVFISNDATMTQLKNSGGLQFIKHGHLADSIAMYDQEVRGIYAAEAPYIKFTNDATDAMSELLVFNLNKDSTGFNQGTRSLFPLLSSNPQRIQVFFNKIKLEQGWTKNYIRNQKEQVPHTNRLIALLKKEYGLQ